jgi:hypothetical protein
LRSFSSSPSTPTPPFSPPAYARTKRLRPRPYFQQRQSLDEEDEEEEEEDDDEDQESKVLLMLPHLSEVIRHLPSQAMALVGVTPRGHGGSSSSGSRQQPLLQQQQQTRLLLPPPPQPQPLYKRQLQPPIPISISSPETLVAAVCNADSSKG